MTNIPTDVEPEPKTPVAEPQEKEVSRSLWADGWRELRGKPLFWMSILVVVVMSTMAVFPWLFTDADPGRCLIQRARQRPSAENWFGFTYLGCPMWASIVYGASKSLAVALFATIGVTSLGMLVGTFAGYFGGWIDTVLSRFTDIFFGLPFLLGAVVFLAIIPIRNVWTISLVIAILGWTSIARIMRGSVLTTKNKDFVEAARALGATNGKIIRRHILPNAIAPIFVMATIYLGVYVGVEATLTYLGVGFQRPTTTWGILIADGQTWALQGWPHLLVIPCAFLVVTVLAFILLGDLLRDAFDPRGR